MQNHLTNMLKPRVISQLEKDMKDDPELVTLVLRVVHFHMYEHPRPSTPLEIRDKLHNWVIASLKTPEES